MRRAIRNEPEGADSCRPGRLDLPARAKLTRQHSQTRASNYMERVIPLAGESAVPEIRLLIRDSGTGWSVYGA
jgi:hypothetical protein